MGAFCAAGWVRWSPLEVPRARPGRTAGRARKHHVAPPRQRPPDAFVLLSPHHDGLAHRRALEEGHVRGDAPRAAATAPEDPVLRRLFPTAYRDDDEAAGEFRRFTEGQLRDGKARAAGSIIDVLEEAGLPAEPTDEDLTIDVELDPETALVWLRALTDLRLALGTRLGHFFNGIGVYVVEGYGLTEASPVLCCNPVDGTDKLGTIGLPFPSTDIKLMGDANSAYTLADIEKLRSLDEFDLMMLEQPLSHDDIIDHAELQRRIKTPICLDEPIKSPDDARKAISLKSGKIINLKNGRVGGHAPGNTRRGRPRGPARGVAAR